MAIAEVKEYFEKWNIQEKIQEFDVSSATVSEAAKALKCEEERIAKSMSFMVKNDPVLIVMAGDTRVDNSKFKGYFKTKAKMIKPDQLEEVIGHSMGGVCPFGIKENVKVYLDESLKRFKTIFPACGSANSAIELTIKELEEYSNYEQWVDLAKYFK